MTLNLLLKKSAVVLVLIIGYSIVVKAQNVAITDEDGYSPDAKAMLDIKSETKGLLIPRVALVNSDDPIGAGKPNGLLVWNTNSADIYSSVGFYFWNGTDWEKVGSNNTFLNGITQTGSEVKLGGSLTDHTTISLGTKRMTFNLNSSGDFNIADNGTSAFWVNSNGNVGIGTTSPDQKFEVSGNIKLGDNIMVEGNGAFKVYRNLASYYLESSSAEGAIVISTNQRDEAVVTIKVTGYFYDSEGPYEVTIKGHWDGNTFEYNGYTTIGAYDLHVRAAQSKNNDALVFILGEDTDVFPFPTFTVTEYYQGLDNNEEAAEGWTITQETDLGAYTNVVDVNNSTTIDLSDLQADIDAEDLWNRSGSTTYLKNSGDNVGFGTSTPLGKLHIVGSSTLGSLIIAPNELSSGDDAEIVLAEDNDNSYSMSWKYDGGNNKLYAFAKENSTIKGPYLSINRSDGRVGIGTGTTTPSSRLVVQGNTTGAIDDPLFEVKNNEGNTVFAVYNEGVRIWVKDVPLGTKGAKGAKGAKGGFAVGGFSSGKGETNELLRVTPDSIRVYVDTDASKAAKGGFAVGGFSSGKTGATDLMRLKIDNYFIGHSSGTRTTGSNNLFFGYESGFENLAGTKNLFIGPYAGHENSMGFGNIFMGYEAGYYNTDADSGSYTGTYGSYNVYIGYKSGKNMTDGKYNTYVGYASGSHSYNGEFNTFIGNQAGNQNSGNRNVLLGVKAGELCRSGSNNVYLGYFAGQRSDASGNVFVGYYAGYNEDEGDKLYIENSTSSDPLIWGDFENDKLKFNGVVGIEHTPNLGYGLVVDGGTSTSYSMLVYKGAYSYGGWSGSSDLRLKKNINKLNGGVLDKVLKLQGVSYYWKTDKYPEMKFDEKKHIGVIAQDVEKLFPELVTENEDGFKGVLYAQFSAVLIEAIKEQQKQIQNKQEQIDDLKLVLLSKDKELEDLRSEVKKIDNLEKQLEKINEFLNIKALNK